MKVPLSWLGQYLSLPPEREMLAALEQYGQGPVNPFVDLSNYVMIELGQPIHVYAASAVDVASTHSRLARQGESLKLLNGETIALDEQDLVIADRTSPLSLAGVMGGDATKIVTTGGDIIVEAGNFRPALVRRTARRHGLMTEASQRSSKLLAPGLVPVALQRFLALLIEHGTTGEITLWQAGSAPQRTSESIVLEQRDIERISGVHISSEHARDILASLGFKAEIIQGHKIAAIAPWWRTDVEHPADLIEEVLRIDLQPYPAAAPREPALYKYLRQRLGAGRSGAQSTLRLGLRRSYPGCVPGRPSWRHGRKVRCSAG